MFEQPRRIVPALTPAHTAGPFKADESTARLLGLSVNEAAITAPGAGGRVKVVAVLWKADDDRPAFATDPESRGNLALLGAAPDLARALLLAFRRLELKSNTCPDGEWKARDQDAFEAARDALKAAGYLK